MLLGLDLGTSSVKALLMEENGDAVGEGSAPYEVRAPQPGWAESSPGEWWDAVLEATGAAVGGRGAGVTALGISGQMHGVVLADEGGSPLRPAVLWADARSDAELAAYRDLDEDLSAGSPTHPPSGCPARASCGCATTSQAPIRLRGGPCTKDWLRTRLTGEVAAEPSDASATLLYDLPADGWSHATLDHLGLRAEMLAPLVSPAEVAGKITAEAAEELGLPRGLPVAAGAADTAAAMLGVGLLRPGPAQLTIGTGGQIVTSKVSPDVDPHLRTHRYRGVLPGLWYSMAAIQNAGLALEWVRKMLGVSWSEVYDEAFDVPPGSGGVTFLPYLSGKRTHASIPVPAAPGRASASTTPAATSCAPPSKASPSRCERASKHWRISGGRRRRASSRRGRRERCRWRIGRSLAAAPGRRARPPAVAPAR